MYEARAPETTTPPPEFPRLLGDIGGTNARFGWQHQVPTTEFQLHRYREVLDPLIVP